MHSKLVIFSSFIFKFSLYRISNFRGKLIKFINSTRLEKYKFVLSKFYKILLLGNLRIGALIGGISVLSNSPTTNFLYFNKT